MGAPPDAVVVRTAPGEDAAEDGPSSSGAGDLARSRLRGKRLAAPEIVALEVLSVLRRLLRSSSIEIHRAGLAPADLAELPLRRASHHQLMQRCWDLRDSLTPYDASYVALAELLGATLLTGDRRLSKAPEPRCVIEVLEPSS